MIKKSIEIILTGETETDIEHAFNEVSRLIKEGYLAGNNQNDTGSFTFDINEINDVNDD